MNWVIKFLRKRLSQEQDIAAFHGSIAGAGRKYQESARMASERIPQLKEAIWILETTEPRTRHRAAVRQPVNQLSIFNS